MTEAYQCYYGEQALGQIAMAPQLELIESNSADTQWMLLLLNDGANTVIDYRDCASNGGKPKRHVIRQPVGQTVLSIVK